MTGTVAITLVAVLATPDSVQFTVRLISCAVVPFATES